MKRAFDFVVALAALIGLSPVLLIVAVLARVKLGRPILFSQPRPGLHGKIFHLYKFRTMKDAVDDQGRPLPDDERMTAFGSFLRSTSLDELPSLLNVLRGDLALVGPRPLLIEYLPLYSSEQARRHDVRPGLTGWAQINGRNSLSWDDKFALDTWYVDHRSMGLDLKILLLTVLKVVRRDGISGDGTATMTRFTGPGSNSQKH